ncbi:uncharacterized protein LOC125757135 [Rhipicephalus sanguineus]|uniref:uncharacterized protein LOC125757135 n=1 Tax=Rhipicephalus sanguineus TaxID=34632 RepID=UPI0020C425CC|nr:uncharacterized protein LOC125757135 [Rhipicephalus sanguineus]
MNRAEAFTSSMYQRSGFRDYFQHQLSDTYRSRPPLIEDDSSTHVLMGLNAVSLLVIVSWVAYATLRRRLLKAVHHYLALYLPRALGKKDSHQAAKKAPKKLLPRASGKKASKRHLETQLDVATVTPTQPDVAGEATAVVPPASVHSVAEGPDGDEDLQDYEIIHTGDAFVDNEDHAN